MSKWKPAAASLVVLALVALACANTPTPIATRPLSTATAAPPPSRTAAARPSATASLPSGAGTATLTPSPSGTPAAPTATATTVSARANPFGVMLSAQVVNSASGMALAGQLRVTYFRPPSAVRITGWDGSCGPCEAARNAGLKLVLTVANSGGTSASAPPTDLAAYQQTLGAILDKYPPAVLVVENEENSTLFYSGTPQQYGAELAAACAVAHSKNIPCTNGGLVSTLVALLVYDNYVQSGQAAQAQDFAARTFTPEQQRLLNSPKVREQIGIGKELLQAYRAAGADYVNFHWYIADTGALAEAVAYLHAQTGLPVITNEVGQFNDDPAQTTAVLGEIVALRLPIAVWFGMDGPQARGLIDAGGDLRATGQAFRNFVRQIP